MPDKRRLTADEWATARRRWEGAPEEGFAWLHREMCASFDVAMTLPAVRQMAIKNGWAKGGEPSSPLKKPRASPKVSAEEMHVDTSKFSPENAAKLASALRPKGRNERHRKDAKAAESFPDSDAVAESFPSKPARKTTVKKDGNVDVSGALVVGAKINTYNEPLHLMIDEQRIAARTGRPMRYRPEYGDIVRRMGQAGLPCSIAEMAAIFKTSEARMQEWVSTYPEFEVAFAEGGEMADAYVANALYMRAVGFTAVKEKPVSVSIGEGRSEIQIVQYREFVAPDVGAAKHWLHNRRPRSWRASVDAPVEVPQGMPTAELLDAIYADKMRRAAEIQSLVAGRMQRLGLVQSISDVNSDPPGFDDEPPEEDPDDDGDELPEEFRMQQQGGGVT